VSRRVALVVVLGFLCASCVPDPDKKPTPDAGSTPRVVLSKQPWRDGGSGTASIRTDGRETQAGYRAGVSAHAGCTDKKCLGDRCGQACTQWMSENYKSFTSTNQRNVIYFNCFGACVAPPDAGRP